MAKRGTKQWKENIGKARSLVRIRFECEYCKKISSDKPSSYRKKKRHFCSMKCYADFQRYLLPKEEHNAFGHGNSPNERIKRRKARSILNHAIRDGQMKREPCEECRRPAEAHHPDYDFPLSVVWLCFYHHRKLHKINRENPDLLTK